MATAIPRLTITYYDDDRSADTVLVGNWEYIQAERKFGIGEMSRGNVDALTYAAFLGAKRARIVDDGVNYDAWAQSVAVVEEVGEGESQAPPAI
jgi:hypothetical protein